MGVQYVSVQWNRQKKFYDAVLIGGVAVYLAIFGAADRDAFSVCHRRNHAHARVRHGGVSAVAHHSLHWAAVPVESEIPAAALQSPARRSDDVPARPDSRGVWWSSLITPGATPIPFLSIFKGSPSTVPSSGVPFQPFGFFALIILFLMAATSHDFWLANLSAPVWKSLHMLVYVAYALLVCM